MEKVPAKLQPELCEIKKDHFLLSQNVENTLEFWKLVPSDMHPNLCDFSLWMLSVFFLHMCVKVFSHMNKIKSKEMDCRMKV